MIEITKAIEARKTRIVQLQNENKALRSLEKDVQLLIQYSNDPGDMEPCDIEYLQERVEERMVEHGIRLNEKPWKEQVLT
jgi:hypothetical protein